MTEKINQPIFEAENNSAGKEKKSADALFIRHSKAGYQTDVKNLKSEDPRAPFNPNEQITPDVPEAGIELAKEKAEELFNSLDSKKDKLFFVSSNESRAIETANIYKKMAKEKGFEVIKPENSRSKVSDEVADGDVRVLENLSLNPKDTLLFNVFVPEKMLQQRSITWDAVDDKFKKKWAEARELINNDDQGSYGANLRKHSEAIKEIFPESQATQEMYDRNFKNLIRIGKWAENKFNMRGNNIKIISFGHENYLMPLLDKFNEEGIGNCESISVTLDEQPTASFRGKEVEID